MWSWAKESLNKVKEWTAGALGQQTYEMLNVCRKRWILRLCFLRVLGAWMTKGPGDSINTGGINNRIIVVWASTGLKEHTSSFSCRWQTITPITERIMIGRGTSSKHPPNVRNARDVLKYSKIYKRNKMSGYLRRRKVTRCERYRLFLSQSAED
jgi:hypothetical protein